MVKDTLNTFEVRSAFLGSSKDLMSFLREREEALSGALTLSSAEERASSLSEDTLILFCRLAVEFDEDFRITDRYEQSGGFTYPLIFAR